MNFLLLWTATQIVFVIVVFGGGSVAGLCLVRWSVPLDRLQKNHEVAGVTFGVLGAFYGLVLAFVIVAAWDGSIRPMPTRFRKRRRWRASINSVRLSPNRCARSSIRLSSNTHTL